MERLRLPGARAHCGRAADLVSAAGGDGRVYLYTLDSSDQWLLQQTIVPDAENAGNRFGFGFFSSLIPENVLNL